MTSSKPKITATVSGSFRRHMKSVSEAVQELEGYGVRVLSPEDPRVVDNDGDFLYVASDKVRSIRLVQDRHLSCIRCSSFLWLVCPDGYVGPSAAMELGFAFAAETPVFATKAPMDLTMRRYVHLVSGISEAVEIIRKSLNKQSSSGILVDPLGTIEAAHRKLDRMDQNYKKIILQRSPIANFYEESIELARIFSLNQTIIDE